MIRKIKIIKTPQGEAPLWVREAWIGTELPIVEGTGLETFYGTGVLSGQDDPWKISWLVWMQGALIAHGYQGQWVPMTGYLVFTATALDILSETALLAAQWWQKNTPHLLSEQLIFDKDACQLISEDDPITNSGS